jgi:hypothetical protein
METPAVDVPLSHLACQGSKGRDFSSLFARRHGDELTVAFPMPYADGARLSLVNPSTAAAAVVWSAAQVDGRELLHYEWVCPYYGTLGATPGATQESGERIIV